MSWRYVLNRIILLFIIIYYNFFKIIIHKIGLKYVGLLVVKYILLIKFAQKISKCKDISSLVIRCTLIIRHVKLFKLIFKLLNI